MKMFSRRLQKQSNVAFRLSFVLATFVYIAFHNDLINLLLIDHHDDAQIPESGAKSSELLDTNVPDHTTLTEYNYYRPECPPHPELPQMKQPYGYIPHTIRSKAQTICSGSSGLSSYLFRRRSRSKITIYSEYISDLQNVLVDFSKRRRVGSLIIHDRGFITVDCKFRSLGNIRSNEDDDDFNGDGGNYITSSIVTAGTMTSDHVVDDPVIVLSRDDCGNTFHALADFLTIFSTRSITLQSQNELLEKVKILILDEKLMSAGADPDLLDGCPYQRALYSLVGGGNSVNVLRGWDLRGKRVMFKRLIVPVERASSKSVLNLIWNTNACDLPLVLGQFVDNLFIYQMKLNSLVENTLEQKKRRSDHIHITLVSRRRKPFGVDQISRVIVNEVDLVRELEKIPKATVTCVELYDLEFGQQLKLMRTTDILIGMHGAGLANIVYTPTDAHLIELIPFTWESSEYRRLTLATGRQYKKWRNSDKEKHIEPTCNELKSKLSVQGPPICRFGVSKTIVDTEAINLLVQESVDELFNIM